MPSPWSAVAACGAATLIVTGLAACGGSSSPASTQTTTTAASRTAFADCLRSHGVTIPRGGPGFRRGGAPPAGGQTGPTGPSGPTRRFGPSGPRGRFANPQDRKAFQACRKYAPQGRGGFFAPGRGGGAGTPDFQAFTKCLRAHGVANPRSGTASRAKIQAAMKACRSKLPTPPAGGTAPPGATTTPGASQQ